VEHPGVSARTEVAKGVLIATLCFFDVLYSPAISGLINFPSLDCCVIAAPGEALVGAPRKYLGNWSER